MKRMYYLLYSVLILISSCSKEIPLSELDFAGGALNYDIAVEGFVSNEKERCRIKLSKPVSISENIEYIPIDDAIIILKHRNNIYTFQLDSNGVYFTIDSIVGLAGETYNLEIDWNDKSYTAEEIMPNAPNDEYYIPFSYEPSYDDSPNPHPRPYNPSFVMLGIQHHNFGYEKTNAWGFEEPRHNSDTFPNWDLYISMDFGIYTHKGSIPQGIFPPSTGVTGVSGAATDSIEIIKAEISERYNQYLLDKFNETDWQGGMFSTIPGNVSTNLSEGAIGYFYALNVKRKRFVIGDFDEHD